MKTWRHDRIPSRQHVVHHFAVDVCEPIVAALMTEGEAFVVDAELVQDGGLQIMDVHRLLSDVDTVVIRLAVGDAAAHTAAGQPVGKTVRVMVSTVNLVCEFALTIDRAAEFATPDDERVLEHAALLEIL